MADVRIAVESLAAWSADSRPGDATREPPGIKAGRAANRSGRHAMEHARGRVEHFFPGANAFERSGTNESARHHIHLDLEGRRAAKLRVDGGRIHGAQLDDRIAVARVSICLNTYKFYSIRLF